MRTYKQQPHRYKGKEHDGWPGEHTISLFLLVKLEEHHK